MAFLRKKNTCPESNFSTNFISKHSKHFWKLVLREFVPFFFDLSTLFVFVKTSREWAAVIVAMGEGRPLQFLPGKNKGPVLYFVSRSATPMSFRWLHCPRKSESLIGGKFLAFKTPLDGKYDDQVSAECRFPPKMLFDAMRSHKVTIGLWIDLCNTDRWYNKRDVEQMECKYVKIQCRGHGEAPSTEAVNMFVNICRRFAQQNPLQVTADI